MINYLSKIGVLCLVGILCAGCAEPGQESVADAANGPAAVQRAEPPEGLDPAARATWLIEAAQAAYADSQAAGHAWVNASRALEDARTAAAQGDFASAGAQGEKALRLAEASLAQARTEESAWQDRFPKPTAQ
jgi:hypothetical protein